MRDYGQKFENNPSFELVFEKQNNTYPYRIYKYQNASPIISVVKGNFVSYKEFEGSIIESFAEKNMNTKEIIPFISNEEISLSGDYSLLPAEIIRESPDHVEINFDIFSGEEGVLFKESYYPSWKAKEYPSGKSLSVYKTANNFMLVIPNSGSNKIIIYQSKSFLDYFGIFVSLISFILLIYLTFSKPLFNK